MSAPPQDHARLAALADQADTELAGSDPLTVLRWAAEEFGERLCVAVSMVDAALPHLASLARPGVDVLFLDTGYHFAETIRTRDAIAATLPVNVRSIAPRQSVAEQDAEFGPRLFEREPDRCCAMRKTEPLRGTLAPYHAWVTGLRRDEAVTRSNIGVVEWDAQWGLVKINPIAAWSLEDLSSYLTIHNLPVNPLVHDGYPSIGCAPCTRRVQPGEDIRAGRWAGASKTECGLHGRGGRS
ncbi:MAG: phosphoadenylyl-sulfate reductase [Mycobacteriales bacterium]